MKFAFVGYSGHFGVLFDALNITSNDILAVYDKNEALTSVNEKFIFFRDEHLFLVFLRNSGFVDLSGLVCIGGAHGIERCRFIDEFLKIGLTVPVVSHVSSVVSKLSEVGIGSHVLANAVIGPNSLIGPGCIINTASSVDHDCELGKGVHVCPGVTIAGHVKIGNYSTIYSGAVIGPRVTIGNNVIVSAGSVVLRDVSDNSRIFGLHR